MNPFFKKRNPLLLLIAFLSLTLLNSCSEEKEPVRVAKKFVELTNKGEFEEAKKYCDESTAALLDVAKKLVKMTKEEIEAKDGDIEIVSSEINEEGDKATVKYKEPGEGEDDMVKHLDLIKIDGEWKVTIDKENMKKEGSRNIPENNMEVEYDKEIAADTIQ